MSPTDRHLSNVSLELCSPGTKPRRWAPPLVARFGLIPRVKRRFDFQLRDECYQQISQTSSLLKYFVYLFIFSSKITTLPEKRLEQTNEVCERHLATNAKCDFVQQSYRLRAKILSLDSTFWKPAITEELCSSTFITQTL